MRQFLNSLYVTTQGAWLACDGQSVDVRVDKESRLRVPIQTLSSIVCFGQVSCSSFLLGLCAEHGVKVAFLTENGRFLARVEGPVSGNVLLRRRQYRYADLAEHTSALAFSIVLAKLANCRSVLLRGARDSAPGEGAEELERAAKRMAQMAAELKPASPVAELRGYEGEAARTYFSVFDHLIVGDKQAFFFRKRSRRPPLDNVNALLSFVYTLLTHDMSAALETVGLDPAVGYLHVERPGRPSLALDLVEELRPVIADRLVLTLINRRQLAAEDFQQLETGGVIMNDAVRKEVLVAYQKRKQEEMLHPFLQEKIPFGMVPFVQATLLARHLRGDLPTYRVPYGSDLMMLVVVAYDVNTETAEGRRRLRRVARVCKDNGQRVQNSVFECWIDMASWVVFRARLLKEIAENRDSLRFYFLGDNWRGRVEHVGAKESYDPGGPLIV